MERTIRQFSVAFVAFALFALLGAGPAAGSPKSAANGDIERQLSKVLPEVKFDKVRLEDAIAWLADTTGANVWVAWKELEADGGITRDTTVSLDLRNVKAITALTLLLRDASTLNCPAGVKLDDGVAVVARVGRPGADLVTRAYDVRDLVVSAMVASEAVEAQAAAAARARSATQPATPAPAEKADVRSGGGALFGSGTGDRLPQERAADGLVKVVIEHVTAAEWRDNGGSAVCRYFAGKLIISHTPDGHAAVATFLEVLRKEK